MNVIVQTLLLLIATTMFIAYYMISSIVNIVRYDLQSSIDNYILNNYGVTFIITGIGLIFMFYILYNVFNMSGDN